MTKLILPHGDRRDELAAFMSRDAAPRVYAAETFLREKGVNVFRCPVCGKEFRQADEYEPGCTGPNETTDDHPMTVMTFVRVDPFPRFTLVRP